MKKNHITFICIFFSCIAWSQELSLMTYNIRYATVNDKENQWEKRKEYLTQQIDFYTPDVFGIQEGFIHNWLLLTSRFQVMHILELEGMMAKKRVNTALFSLILKN